MDDDMLKDTENVADVAENVLHESAYPGAVIRAVTNSKSKYSEKWQRTAVKSAKPC